MPASAQSGARMWRVGTANSCMDVPGGNFATDVQLILYPCQSSPNQYFVLEADGHLVANGGNPNSAGVRMCVEAVDRRIVLRPCRRLTTGDGQWWQRDPWAFFKSNSPRIECLGYDPRSGGHPPLIVRPCHYDNGNGVLTRWFPHPYSTVDQKFDDAALAIALKGNHVPNEPPTYDPEVRSRFEDNVRAYGPYVSIRDVRTNYCIIPSRLLSTLMLGGCGRPSLTFQRDSLGRLREVSGSGRTRGVSGRCLTATTGNGGAPTLTACGTSGLQRWWLHDKGQIQSQSAAAGNRCLDVKDDRRDAGALVILWRCDVNRPGNQAFQVTLDWAFRS